MTNSILSHSDLGIDFANEKWPSVIELTNINLHTTVYQNSPYGWKPTVIFIFACFFGGFGVALVSDKPIG